MEEGQSQGVEGRSDPLRVASNMTHLGMNAELNAMARACPTPFRGTGSA